MVGWEGYCLFCSSLVGFCEERVEDDAYPCADVAAGVYFCVAFVVSLHYDFESVNEEG